MKLGGGSLYKLGGNLTRCDLATHYIPIKGTQPKIYQKGMFIKEDLFGGEAITEVLISEFLYACGESNYVTYTLGDSLTMCESESYRDDDTVYITFVGLLVVLGYNKGDWLKQTKHMLPEQRYQLVEGVYLSLGISGKDIHNYFSRMLTLDYIFSNEDRHLNNFGVNYNYAQRCYTLPKLYDNGLSLGNKYKLPLIMKSYLLTRHKLKAQPYSSNFNANLDVVGVYNFNFNEGLFHQIHDERIPKTSPYYRLFALCIKNQFNIDLIKKGERQ